MLRTITYVLLILCLSAGQASAGRDGEKTFIIARNGSAEDAKYFVKTLEATRAAEPGQTFYIEGNEGDLVITTWDRDEISVKATLEMVNIDRKNETLFDAESEIGLERYRDGYRLSVELPEGSAIELKHLPRIIRGRIKMSDDGGIYWPMAKANLAISLPRRMNLILETSYGDVTVDDLEGAVEVVNDSGAVGIADCRGPVEVENSYGSVTVSACPGDVVIRNDSGKVNLQDIGGDVTAYTSYDMIDVQRVGGRVEIHNDSGEVRVSDTAGEVRVESSYESVSVTHARGPVTIRCDSGDITVDDVQADVDLTGGYNPITCSNITGKLSISGDSSRISCREVTGLVEIDGSYEPIDLSDIRGDVFVEGSSCEVSVIRVAGNADIRSSYEGISVKDVSGDCLVEAESSSVDVEGVGGETRIKSSYEMIKARGVEGALNIRGDSSPVLVEGVKGQVDIASSYEYVIVRGAESSIAIAANNCPVEISQIADLPAGGTYDVSTTYERITLVLPPDASAEIQARTRDGDIKSEFPMQIHEDGITRGETTLGGGDCVIRLETSDDIYIKKGR